VLFLLLAAGGIQINYYRKKMEPFFYQIRENILGDNHSFRLMLKRNLKKSLLKRFVEKYQFSWKKNLLEILLATGFTCGNSMVF
jgi:hypothetical protein